MNKMPAGCEDMEGRQLHCCEKSKHVAANMAKKIQTFMYIMPADW